MIIQVLEVIGRENIKLTQKQLDEVIELLKKEEAISDEKEAKKEESQAKKEELQIKKEELQGKKEEPPMKDNPGKPISLKSTEDQIPPTVLKPPTSATNNQPKKS